MRTLTDFTTNLGKSSFVSGLSVITLACVVVLMTSLSAASQGDCAISELSDPHRQLITCGEGLLVEREPGADISIVERRGAARPKSIMLENGAIFIEVLPGSQQTQIRTPHAIAAVRGTTYVVDASATSTSVFVIEGAVTVSKPDDGASVTLGPGQGVDVDAATPLNVSEWSDDRVSGLLARFGR